MAYMRPCKLLLLFALVVSIQGSCIREYFAQPVIYDKTMNIDFYHTGINMPSVTACAEYCADRHFCRTAVYNSFSKTCALSYEYTLNCRYNPSRYKEYPLDQVKSHLIQIACIEKCNEKSKNSVSQDVTLPQILTAEPFDRSALPKVLKKVEIVTGEPLAAISPTDYAQLARARSSVSRPGSVAVPASSEEGYVNRLVIENITEFMEAHDQVVSRFMQTGSKMCYREIPQKYLLGGSFARYTDKSIKECRCLCAATFNSGNVHICQSFQWYTNGVCVLNKGNHLGKFDLIKDKHATYEYVDCDAQVLLDVATKLCGSGDVGKDIVIRASPRSHHKKETFTLPVIEPSPFDPISGKVTTLEPKIEKKVTTVATSTTSAPVVEEVEKEAEASGEPSEEDIKERKENEIEQEKIETKNAEKNMKIEEKKTTETQKSSVDIKSTKKFDVNEVDPPVLTSEKPERSEQEVSSGEKNCFEHIDGYMMVNVAGGLEHDVSMEECQCICANSKASGRYNFECVSATYYHNERDCVLNLESRTQNTQRFEKQFEEYNVTYIGITCSREKVISQVVKAEFSNGCKKVQTPVTSPAPKRLTGENSDKCYMEMPFYVLEGTAQQVEVGVSAQQCKCLCAQSEQKYGEPCQSFQYYFESKTCLLSKYNRFSSPESFNFMSSPQKRSYFEFTCATNESNLKNYVATVCQLDDDVSLRNELIKESENEILQIDNLTTSTSSPSSSEKTIKTVKTSIQKKPLKIDFDTHFGEVEKVDSSTEIARNAVRKVSSEVKVNDGEEQLKEVNLRSEKKEEALDQPKKENLKPEDTLTATQESSVDRQEEKVEKKNENTEENNEVLTTKEEMNQEEDEENEESNKQTEEQNSPDQEDQENKEEDEVEEEIEIEDKQEDEEEDEETAGPEEEKKVDTVSTTTVVTTTVLQSTTPKKIKKTHQTKILRKKKVIFINRRIPETEGLLESDFDYEPDLEMSSETSATTIDTTSAFKRQHKNIIMDEPLNEKNSKLMDILKKAHGVKTKKFTEKEQKPQDLLVEKPTTVGTTSTITTTPKPVVTSTFITTTTAEYPAVDKCTYSALYQTSFQGRRLLKTVFVKSAVDCFAACYALQCRSANLISQGAMNQCDLYRDSLIDYRRPDMIGFDGSSVYFDGIRCGN